MFLQLCAWASDHCASSLCHWLVRALFWSDISVPRKGSSHYSLFLGPWSSGHYLVGAMNGDAQCPDQRFFSLFLGLEGQGITVGRWLVMHSVPRKGSSHYFGGLGDQGTTWARWLVMHNVPGKGFSPLFWGPWRSGHYIGCDDLWRTRYTIRVLRNVLTKKLCIAFSQEKNTSVL